ncbi:ATP-binding protein [Synechococcus sp. Cruz-9H2]|uniref:ATP-binding protein n=1 Tax=unclassified Synechococcus TaxID=2626047 RepID=UPI0020CE8585|nr:MULTISPECIES: ATP-binding protein [unclassified Synechococcus]MCP9818537.1 ATP-binding protein [Synechococcus sp. Cruz-9H2]MCP9842768.1 ATP-binding protein [Synechococcus sp. Edmonson 11F2]MCP9855433.1 ATP-binding protein [Synechococcus sp. Cruz-9C9]MCP9862320.1 ATP-binding protein [Synechococcus sp. Cruz-7E5]MCP9869592.1 ATP-binding protein [Synechococcus sp. Cruz-7B9]
MSDQLPHRGGLASFPSRLEEIQALLDWFELTSPPGLDPMLWIQAQTVLVEGFTNAVRHANAHLTNPPPVEVALDVTPEHLQLRIRDHGAPFDISAALAGAEEPLGEGQPGGDPPTPPAPDGDGLPALPYREAHWGLIMLGRLRRDFGWAISYERLPGGGNELVLQRALS